MGTTIKSEFLEGLTDPETVLGTVKDVDCIVFDGMAIIQMLPVPTSAAKPTYNDITHYSGNMFCVLVRAFQLDKYLANSLKSQTREKRGEDMLRHTSVHKGVRWPGG